MTEQMEMLDLLTKVQPKSIEGLKSVVPQDKGIYRLMCRANTPVGGSWVNVQKRNFPGVGCNFVAVGSSPSVPLVEKGDLWEYEYVEHVGDEDLHPRDRIRLKNIGTQKYLRVERPGASGGSFVFAEGEVGQEGTVFDIYHLKAQSYGFNTSEVPFWRNGKWITVERYIPGFPYRSLQDLGTLENNFFKQFPEYAQQCVHLFSFEAVG